MVSPIHCSPASAKLRESRFRGREDVEVTAPGGRNRSSQHVERNPGPPRYQLRRRSGPWQCHVVSKSRAARMSPWIRKGWYGLQKTTWALALPAFEAHTYVAEQPRHRGETLKSATIHPSPSRAASGVGYGLSSANRTEGTHLRPWFAEVSWSAFSALPEVDSTTFCWSRYPLGLELSSTSCVVAEVFASSSSTW